MSSKSKIILDILYEEPGEKKAVKRPSTTRRKWIQRKRRTCYAIKALIPRINIGSATMTIPLPPPLCPLEM
jgi:hypothetical protein